MIIILRSQDGRNLALLFQFSKYIVKLWLTIRTSPQVAGVERVAVIDRLRGGALLEPLHALS